MSTYASGNPMYPGVDPFVPSAPPQYPESSQYPTPPPYPSSYTAKYRQCLEFSKSTITAQNIFYVLGAIFGVFISASSCVHSLKRRRRPAIQDVFCWALGYGVAQVVDWFILSYVSLIPGFCPLVLGYKRNMILVSVGLVVVGRFYFRESMFLASKILGYILIIIETVNRSRRLLNTGTCLFVAIPGYQGIN